MNAKVGGKLLHGHHAGQIVFCFCRHFLSNSSAPSTPPPSSPRTAVLLISCYSECYPKPTLTTSDILKTVCAGQEASEGVPLTLSTVVAVHVASCRIIV